MIRRSLSDGLLTMLARALAEARWARRLEWRRERERRRPAAAKPGPPGLLLQRLYGLIKRPSAVSRAPLRSDFSTRMWHERVSVAGSGLSRSLQVEPRQRRLGSKDFRSRKYTLTAIPIDPVWYSYRSSRRPDRWIVSHQSWFSKFAGDVPDRFHRLDYPFVQKQARKPLHSHKAAKPNRAQRFGGTFPPSIPVSWLRVGRKYK